jgi:16S rRNA (cytidine1402-2'-O)-methyltransferase
MGTLYVVSTPIGNLEDISLRALRVLKEVSLIAAEDTRHTRKLLNHFSISTRLISYHQHSDLSRTEDLLEALRNGDVALVADAGTPGLSDPGGELVASVVAAGIAVSAVPGASALLALAASSGVPAARFVYLGFMPRKGKERAELIDRAAGTGWPFFIYESPRRLVATLGELRERLGDAQVAVGRELTKLHEEVFRGTLSEAVRVFTERAPRGEVTIMVSEVPQRDADHEQGTEVDLDDLLITLRARGLAPREVARQAATQLGVSRREAYNRLFRSRTADDEY